MKFPITLVVLAATVLCTDGGLRAAQENAALTVISTDGVMSLFGNWQVLCTGTTKSEAGNSALKHYCLAQGESEDGIRVVSIDGKSGLVCFDNHGVIQFIRLGAVPVVDPPSPIPPLPADAPDLSGGPGRFGMHSSGARRAVPIEGQAE